MADKRSVHIKKILAADMAFTNVLVGILMIFFESLWLVILFDSGRMVLGHNLGWDIQMISVAVIVILTVPYLLSSLFMASSMTDVARMIVGVCSVLIGVAAAAFAVGVWMEAGSQLEWSFLMSRLPWILFGLFAVIRMRKLKNHMAKD